MKYKNEIYARNWTQDTIYCYQRGCRCENCYMKNLLESTFCNLKQVVIELVRKYGAPENKEKCLSDKELMLNKSYLYKLTPAEEKIYQLILQGYGQTALIKLTKKSAGTIKTQISAIFQKKGVHSVKELRSLEEEECKIDLDLECGIKKIRK